MDLTNINILSKNLLTEFKYKKLYFYKNKTKEGAQRELIRFLNEEGKINDASKLEGVMICKWNFLSKDKNPRYWYSHIPYNKLDNFLNDNNYLYEILSKYPKKIYFDLDIDRHKLETEDEFKKFKDLEQYKKEILDYFPNANFSISGSYENDKISFHIILNNYIIRNEDELEFLKKIVSNIGFPFDSKVYSKNKQFKFPNQQKKPDRQPQIIIEDENIFNHIITYMNQPIENYMTFDMFDKIEYDFIKTNDKEIKEKKEKINKIKFIKRVSTPIDIIKYHKLIKEEEENIFKRIERAIYEKSEYYIDNNKYKILLESLPINLNYGYDYTFYLMKVWQCLELDKEDYLNWYNNKHNDEFNLNKKSNEWDRLIKSNIKISPYQLKHILGPFYNDIFDVIDKIRFKKLFDISNKTQKKTDYLTQSDFLTEKQCLVLKLPMNSGKTAQTIDYIKRFILLQTDKASDDVKILFISHSISLLKNTYQRLKASGININLYTDNDKFIDPSTNRKYEKGPFIKIQDQLLICINSIEYIKNMNWDLVIIDEVESILHKASDIEILRKNNRRDKASKKIINDSRSDSELVSDHFEKLFKIMRYSKKLILLDAFINNKSLNLLENLNIEYDLITKEPVKGIRTVYEIPNYNIMRNRIIQDLKDNKKLIVFYPAVNKNKNIKKSKPHNPFISIDNFEEDLKNIIKNETGRELKTITHYSDNINNDKLKNINKVWADVDLVISNNSITCGLNYDNNIDIFDNVYLFIAGHNKAFEMCQFTMRTRELKGNIYFNFLNGREQFKPPIFTENEIFNKLSKLSAVELKYDNRKALLDYFDMAGYEINLNDNTDEENKIYFDVDYSQMAINNYFFVDFDKIDIEGYNISDLITKKLIQRNKFTDMDYLRLNKLLMLDILYQYKKSDIKDLWHKGFFGLVNIIHSIKNNQSSNKNKLISKTINAIKHLTEFNKNLKIDFKSDLLEQINKEKKAYSNNTADHLIIKEFLNSIFNYQVIKTKKEKGDNNKYLIDPLIISLFENIQENKKPLETVEDLIIDDVDILDEIKKIDKIDNKENKEIFINLLGKVGPITEPINKYTPEMLEWN
jgi:hypothetical protein